PSDQIVAIVVQIIAILFVLVTHEFAHAYVAYKFGDTTAKDMGRLSLNPLKHLDLIGTLSLFLFRFGWAKPVPINSNNFKNHKLGMFCVSIAGIVINLITALIALFIIYLFQLDGVLYLLFNNIFIYGIVFAIFNILPIPPLDGSKMIATFLPLNWQYKIYEYEKYGSIVLIFLISMGIINKIMYPLITSIANFYIKLVIRILYG
ncbi:MAG: site-2 protease family protein, partial [Helcococcus sp.]|nr:site-2 protease family protein [Helcococcus sp.]